MADLACNCAGNMLVFLLVLFYLASLQRIEGYVLQMSESSEEHQSSSFNDETNGPVPSCNNTTYCEDTPYYPSDLVEVLLSANNHLKFFATVDEAMEPYRQDFSANGEALCSSQEMLVMPKTALSVDGSWLYVVNYKDYVQAVRVEVCRAERRPCKIIDGFSDGWITTCQQTYIFRQMIALTRDGSIAPQLFKLPASCKCFVKYTGDPFMRLGSRHSDGKRIKNSPK